MKEVSLEAFLDILATTKINPSIESTKNIKLLLDKEEFYLAKLREIQTSYFKLIPNKEAGSLGGIFKKLDQIYDEIAKFDPEYVSSRRAKPVSLREIQNILSSFGKDVLLVEYFVTEKEIFIFTVSSRDKKLRVKSILLDKETLFNHFKNYRNEVVLFPWFGSTGETWLDLGKYIIEPISDLLAVHNLICFVPHGILHAMPLHALELNGEPLIKNHPIAYSPSSSIMKFCSKKGKNKLQSAVSFGFSSNQDLNLKTIIENTATSVAKLFKANAFNFELATKLNVLKECANKDVVHFSCHGYFNPHDPLSSGIALHKGEILTAREIFQMRLKAEIVTIGACETGLNMINLSDEIVGLTRAFLYAGAHSIIGSLWSVDGSSTQELILEFYSLITKGYEKTTALQEATKKVMEKNPHPFYWAPFILIGKP